MNTKKTLLTASIAIVLLLTVYSCMISFGTGVGSVSATTTTTASASALSQHLITSAQAKALTNEYTSKNYRLINVGKPDPDTKEVYYDIEVLQDYINYVKAEAKKKKLKNVGITIAFGQYPDKGTFDQRLKKEYEGKQTVYLKAATKSLPGSGKVGMGGSGTEEMALELEDISAFDFGNLTPPER